MRRRINKALNPLGLIIEGGFNSGVFYFVDVKSNLILDAESVYVSAMTHLSVKQWVKEAKLALKTHKERISQRKNTLYFANEAR